MFRKITTTLETALQVILTAPVKLPPKVVRGAQLASLALTLINALTQTKDQDETPDTPQSP